MHSPGPTAVNVCNRQSKNELYVEKITQNWVIHMSYFPETEQEAVGY